MKLSAKKILALILLFVSIKSFAQIEDNKNRFLYKTNKIKSVKVYEYKSKEGQQKGNGKLLFKELYDTLGLQVESYSYIMGEFRQQYKYNEKGDLLEETGYVLNSPVTTTYSYKYDNNGRMIEKSKTSLGGKWYYTYDSLSNIESIKWFWFDESEPTSYFLDRFDYKDRNKMTKMIRYRADGSIYFYKTYDYDNDKNLIKEIRFEKGDTTDVWNYIYDTKGNCIEGHTFDNLKKKESSWYKTNFDDKGLIIEERGKLSSQDKEYFRKYFYEYWE